MRITSSPAVLQVVFHSMKPLMRRPQFLHLRCFLLTIVMSGQPKLRNTAQATTFGRHRTSLGHFLSESEWDEETLLNSQVVKMLKTMKPCKGEYLYLIIDDTRIAKRGRKMEDVSKLWDHARQRYAQGHTVVFAAISFRGVTLPCRLRVWQSRDWAGKNFMKLTEIAAEMIGQFQPPPGVKVRVLFDAFYLCPAVTKCCESRRFSWFSVASKNRTIKRTAGKSGKLKQLAAGVLKYSGKRVRLKRSTGWRWMRIATTNGRLAKIGDVRIVFSKRPGDPWKKTLAVATNELNRSPREIIAIYEKRWNIEVLFKELRSELGLGDYQMLKRKGIRRHLHLVSLAHLLLTHHSLKAVGAQARQKKTEIPLPTFRERITTLRQQIQHDQIRRFTKRIKHKRIQKRVQEYLLNL